MSEDGTAIKYTVRSGNQFIDPGKPAHIISDLIDPVELLDNSMFKDFLEKGQDCITKSFLFPHHGNQKFNTVESLISSKVVNKFMEHYQWNYLHYACLFCSKKEQTNVIKEIFNTKNEETKRFRHDGHPNKFATQDKFGRYPLHLACKSGASKEVIEALLEHKEHKDTILKSGDLTKVSKEHPLKKCRLIIRY